LQRDPPDLSWGAYDAAKVPSQRQDP